MSSWTHIVAAMAVNTYERKDDIAAYVRHIMRDAPKITGSESDADIFVVERPGHDIGCYPDCGRCPYENSEGCNPPEEYVCKNGHYTTTVIITVFGNLRDRLKDRTKQEYKEFKKYIKQQGWSIEYQTCNIEGW